jgi:hypothetical protein
LVELHSIGVNSANFNALNAEQLSLNFNRLAEDGWEYVRDLNTDGYSVSRALSVNGDACL